MINKKRSFAAAHQAIASRLHARAMLYAMLSGCETKAIRCQNAARHHYSKARRLMNMPAS